VIWTATLVSNVGGWMYSAACGWLMTSLNPDAFAGRAGAGGEHFADRMFAIPAGALADISTSANF